MYISGISNYLPVLVCAKQSNKMIFDASRVDNDCQMLFEWKQPKPEEESLRDIHISWEELFWAHRPPPASQGKCRVVLNNNVIRGHVREFDTFPPQVSPTLRHSPEPSRRVFRSNYLSREKPPTPISFFRRFARILQTHERPHVKIIKLSSLHNLDLKHCGKSFSAVGVSQASKKPVGILVFVQRSHRPAFVCYVSPPVVVPAPLLPSLSLLSIPLCRQPAGDSVSLFSLSPFRPRVSCTFSPVYTAVVSFVQTNSDYFFRVFRFQNGSAACHCRSVSQALSPPLFYSLSLLWACPVEALLTHRSICPCHVLSPFPWRARTARSSFVNAFSCLKRSPGIQLRTGRRVRSLQPSQYLARRRLKQKCQIYAKHPRTDKAHSPMSSWDRVIERGGVSRRKTLYNDECYRS